ncbi:MAG: MFS transporter [Acidobacteria bacterium]|nr:MFS transporter [Acidobacteriota bacterium]
MPLVAYLWVAFALNYVDRQMVYSMFPALQSDLGFVGAKLGLIGSVFQWVYTLSMPIAGRMADTMRRDVLLVSSLILWSLATFGCGMATSENEFLAWRAIMGITEALYYPTALAVIAAHYPEALRSRALGIHQSAQLCGVVAGGWFGGWAADNIGWRQAFYYACAAGVVYSVVLWLGVRGSGSGASMKRKGNFAALAKSKCYLALCGAFSAFCAIQWIFFAWFPTFLQERFKMSMTDSGWNATLFVQVATIAGILGGGALADYLRKRWRAARLHVAAAGVMFSAPFAYLTFASATLDSARIFSAIFGLFAGLLAANAFAAAYDVIGEDNRGLSGGVLNMTGGISSTFTIYLAGATRNTIGFDGLLIWMMGVAIVCATALGITAYAKFDEERV